MRVKYAHVHVHVSEIQNDAVCRNCASNRALARQRKTHLESSMCVGGEGRATALYCTVNEYSLTQIDSSSAARYFEMYTLQGGRGPAGGRYSCLCLCCFFVRNKTGARSGTQPSPNPEAAARAMWEST